MRLTSAIVRPARANARSAACAQCRATDASKIALAHLVLRLRKGGFRLLDTQFATSHLSRFGVIEIPRDDYRVQLSQALTTRADFPATVTEGEIAAFSNQCG